MQPTIADDQKIENKDTNIQSIDKMRIDEENLSMLSRHNDRYTILCTKIYSHEPSHAHYPIKHEDVML